MSGEVFEVIDPGLFAGFQDQGRNGWRRYGVPTGGAMDDHAAAWANRLLDLPEGTPTVELLLPGAKLRALDDVWIAVTGAANVPNVPSWRAHLIQTGEMLEFTGVRTGLWSYLAVEGGFDAPILFGSASVYPRGKLGTPLIKGDILQRISAPRFQLPSQVAGRSAAWGERRHYDSPPPLRIWPGPQWKLFSEEDRQILVTSQWTISNQSDRAGYRLHGNPLHSACGDMISEPVRIGSIQVPNGGSPIVLMRDGPTVGGYPKIAMLAPEHLSWLAQCRPGQKISFELLHEI